MSAKAPAGETAKQPSSRAAQTSSGPLTTFVLMTAALVVGIAIGYALRGSGVAPSQGAAPAAESRPDSAAGPCVHVGLELQRTKSQLTQCASDLQDVQEVMAGFSANSRAFIDELERSIASKEAKAAAIVAEGQKLEQQQEEMLKSEALRKKRSEADAKTAAAAAAPTAASAGAE